MQVIVSPINNNIEMLQLPELYLIFLRICKNEKTNIIASRIKNFLFRKIKS